MNITIPFGLGIFFGGLLASVIYWKLPAFYKAICTGLDSLYGGKKNNPSIKIEDWRK